MKDHIQQQLRREYEKREDEFSSYVDFINATAAESNEICLFRKKILKPKAAI
jgi:hypothetical protein